MTADTESHAPPAPPVAAGGALAVVMVGTFVTVLDYFIANVAVPSIQADLGATSAQVQGVIVGYGVAFTAGMITGGRLGDMYGRRRMFSLGLAFFLITSAVCGFAPTAEVLTVARVAQGAAAALMVPQVFGIVSTIHTTPQGLARALNIYGLVVGMAAVFGQVKGSSTSRFPRYARSAAGTRTAPSGSWWFSSSGISQRVVASVPLSVAA